MYTGPENKKIQLHNLWLAILSVHMSKVKESLLCVLAKNEYVHHKVQDMMNKIAKNGMPFFYLYEMLLWGVCCMLCHSFCVIVEGEGV